VSDHSAQAVGLEVLQLQNTEEPSDIFVVSEGLKQSFPVIVLAARNAELILPVRVHPPASEATSSLTVS